MGVIEEKAMTAAFKLISAETKPLTPELVSEFRALPPSPVERLRKESRIQHLRDKILAGNAVTFHWAIAELEGKKIRANGMHSSEMLEGLNGQFPDGLTVHMDTYQVDDKQGLVRLFRQFDDRSSSRSPDDVSGAYQMLEEDLIDLDRKASKRAVEGIAWYDDHVEGVKLRIGDDRYALFHEKAVHPFLIWIDSVFDIKTKELEEVPILAAMWATYSRNADKAKEFWELVKRGGEAGVEAHPTTRLDDWLKAAKEKELTIPLKGAEYYNGCIFAWNAFRREDETLVKIKFDRKKFPFEVVE
jgi:hypothetical protein